MENKINNSFSKTLGIETGATFRHIGLFCDVENGKWYHDRYTINIQGETFEFKRGIGNRTYKRLSGCQRDDVYTKCLGMRWSDKTDPQHIINGIYNKYTQAPKDFDIDQLLYSLVLDSLGNNMSFESWCDELGYSSDSIKAFEIYRECQKQTDRFVKVLYKLGTNLDAVTEAFENY